MGFVVSLFPLAALGAVTIYSLRRHADAASRSLALRRVGLGTISVFVAMLAFFTGEEALENPGGWTAIALIAAWAIPLGLITMIVWFRPHFAVGMLSGATALLVIANFFYLFDPAAVTNFENAYGPARAVAALVILTELGVLGYHLSERAIELIVIAATVTIAIQVVAGPLEAVVPFLAFAAPSFAGAAFYEASCRLERRSLAPGLEAEHQHSGELLNS